jgi:transposase InsO family protein
MTSVWVAEHDCCYLMAAIDCCTREIVGWHLELRCRARESIALVEQAAAARTIRPRTLKLGTDNGSALTARQFKLVVSGRGIVHRRGGYRDPRARPSSSPGSQSSKSAASGCTSSRRSTRPGRWSALTSTTTTTGPTRA